jgi:hypothetical protein
MACGYNRQLCRLALKKHMLSKEQANAIKLIKNKINALPALADFQEIYGGDSSTEGLTTLKRIVDLEADCLQEIEDLARHITAM